MKIINITTLKFTGWISLLDKKGFRHIVDADKIVSLTSSDKELKSNIKTKIQNSEYYFPNDYTCDDAIFIIGEARKKPCNHCYDLEYNQELDSYLNFVI